MFHSMDNFRKKHHECIYTVFRVLVGLLFMQHGAMKLFGWFGDQPPVSLASQMGVAGVIEFFGGLLIVVGLATTVVAGIATIEMLVAYIIGHASNGAIPIVNHGELALLFMAAFLYITFAGPGKYSLDAAWCKQCAGKKK